MSEQIKILLQTHQFRFVTKGIIEHNGQPDYRMQTKHQFGGMWKDVVLFDNGIQCSYAMEDPEYAKMLAGLPAYLKK